MTATATSASATTARHAGAAALDMPPRLVHGPEECDFYHAVDLPRFGFQPGLWDLRRGVDAYLGHQPLAEPRRRVPGERQVMHGHHRLERRPGRSPDPAARRLPV